jgi:hypothetical protein
MLRVEYGRERAAPVTADSAEFLPGSWRRWEQAFESYESQAKLRAFSRLVCDFASALSPS